MPELNVPRSRDFRTTGIQNPRRNPCVECAGEITAADAAHNIERDATGTRLRHRECPPV